MTSAKVTSVPLPTSSSLCNPSAPYDYADSYSAVLPDSSMTATDAAWEFFGQAPRWVGTLMRMRNSLVSLFGLKTGRGEQSLHGGPAHPATTNDAINADSGLAQQ